MSMYAGITIGPIFDTIRNASTPAALWFASSIFSDITRKLCEKITAAFHECEILSPYYSIEKNRSYGSDGVGKFHDRIIFRAPEITAVRVKSITDQVKEDIIKDFPEEFRKDRYIKFLKIYLQIHYCIISEEKLKGENPILALSPYLDALELMKTFAPTDADNPFSEMNREKTNARIKRSALFENICRRNQFQNDDGDIRSIEEIAEGSYAVKEYNRLKMAHYFAVVSADGDGMGKFLKQLHSSEEITAFSEACLQYSEKAAEMIARYGGMTIYAGGDDLLFLAPLKGAAEEDAKGENIFALCSRINREFQKIIGKMNRGSAATPTVSFGISIQYEKYPLYEARENASALLFNVIKKEDRTKNSIAVNLQKHSGQSVILRVSNDKIDMLQDFLHAGKGTENDTAGTMRTIRDFREVLKVLDNKAQSEEQFMNAWRNFYDNEGQKPAKSFSDGIGKLYYQNFVAGRRELEDKVEIPNGEENTRINQLLAILALRRFAQEEGDKR